MDLSAALSQMEMVKQIADMLPKRMRPAGLDCAGIIGLPVATRYKKMTVDCVEKLITLTPYGKDEANEINPVEQEGQQREAVIRTWQGKAAKCEFDGESVQLDEWEKLGLKEGGMRVTSVSGEAEKAGLKVGDIITAVVGEPNEKGEKQDMPVRGSSSLVVWACLQDVDSKHTFKIKRGDKVSSLEIKLVDYGWKGEAPEKFRRK
jgi:C-terminal processing protease CtpA/Prc